jgi:hypothetical protein
MQNAFYSVTVWNEIAKDINFDCEKVQKNYKKNTQKVISPVKNPVLVHDDVHQDFDLV